MVKKIDPSLLERASKNAKYPSESAKAEVANTLMTEIPPITDEPRTVSKPLPGRVATGYQIRTEARNTTLWQGNPRNFETSTDISDLKPLLKASNGNSEAVSARLINGKIEVLAGKRRRMACIELDLPLLINVYDDLTDDECHFIADVENRGRKDLNHITYCQYLASRFDELNLDPLHKISVEEFGKKYQLSRQNMQNRISTGRQPSFLFEVSNMAAWGVRQATKVISLYKEILDHGSLTENDVKGRLEFSKTPSAIIATLEGLLPSSKVNEQPAEKTLRVGQGSISIKHSSTGAMTVKLDAKIADALKAKIESLIIEATN